jgi:hypothetical protein
MHLLTRTTTFAVKMSPTSDYTWAWLATFEMHHFMLKKSIFFLTLLILTSPGHNLLSLHLGKNNISMNKI